MTTSRPNSGCSFDPTGNVLTIRGDGAYGIQPASTIETATWQPLP